MRRRTALVVSVIAGVLLGTVSNWIYDLLVEREVFSAMPVWKTAIVVAVAVIPLIVLVVWPEWTERKGARSKGPSKAAPDPQTQALARRNRQALLDRVRRVWIEGVLAKSLYHEARIALGLEERPDAVQQAAAIGRPWELKLRERGQAPRSLDPTTRIVDVFDRMEGALLILGAPGAAKTTLLLELAADLLRRAGQ